MCLRMYRFEASLELPAVELSLGQHEVVVGLRPPPGVVH